LASARGMVFVRKVKSSGAVPDPGALLSMPV